MQGGAGILTLSVAILRQRSGHVGESCRESLSRFTPEPHEAFEIGRDAALGEVVSPARAPFVALLDDQVAVSPGWAARLIGALERSGAGAVGPLSNGAKGLQRRHAAYQDVPGYLTFAQRVAAEHPSQVEFVEILEDFCVLSRRELLAALDPSTPVRDVARSVGTAGHKLAIALDTYLHSFADYYEQTRPEVEHLIPPGVRTLLDVGCGSGALGAALKRRGPIEVVGVELDAAAGERARRVLDRIHLGDIESLELPYGTDTFDCIVLADILEHLRDPWGLLKRLVPLLRVRGRLIASLPNVRHWSVLRGLLEGEWTYLPAGILDRGHLRFFTRASGRALFEAAGLTVIEVQPICSGFIPDLTPLTDASRVLSLDLATLAEEARVTQYLFVTERRA